jgi:hypothetical protein
MAKAARHALNVPAGRRRGRWCCLVDDIGRQIGCVVNGLIVAVTGLAAALVILGALILAGVL